MKDPSLDLLLAEFYHTYIIQDSNQVGQLDLHGKTFTIILQILITIV